MNDLQAVTAATEPPLSRKLHIIGRRLGIPVSGTFELTAGCNFNCRMCYIHDKDAAPRADGELTAECLLPVMVDHEMKQGKLEVSVLKSGDKWFGMTYQEDRKIVAEELRRLHAASVYPESLKEG